VLDVQSTKASAFTEEDIAILQILADQIALAIDNTRLLQESQQSLDELQNLYSTNVIEAWHKHLANKTIGYTYNRLGVDPLESPSGMADQPEKTGSGTTHGHPLNEVDPYLLHVPLTLRGQVLGYLQLKRGSGQSAWTPEEMETVSSIVIQLGLALENARLLAEIRQHARNEQLIGHIASQVQSSLDIETVMKRTVMEIGQAFRANRVRIQLGNGDSPSNGHNSPDEDLPWS
jgi:GAF domain-containing protein